MLRFCIVHNFLHARKMSKSFCSAVDLIVLGETGPQTVTVSRGTARRVKKSYTRVWCVMSSQWERWLHLLTRFLGGAASLLWRAVVFIRKQIQISFLIPIVSDCFLADNSIQYLTCVLSTHTPQPPSQSSHNWTSPDSSCIFYNPVSRKKIWKFMSFFVKSQDWQNMTLF